MERANKYRVGDKVYFSKSFEEINWKSGKPKPAKTTYPTEKKIRKVCLTKKGIQYQVKGGLFHQSWIGKYVFDTKEEAIKAIER